MRRNVGFQNEKTKTSGLYRKKSAWGWLFVSPFLVGFVLIYLKVFFTSLYFSIYDITPTGSGYTARFAGFENFRQVLFVNTEFNRTVLTSVGTMLFNVPVIIIVSLFLAVLLNRDMKGRGFFRAVFFLPVILATGIIAVAEQNNSVVGTMWNVSGIETGVAGGGTSALIDALDVQKYLLSLNLSSEFTGYIVNVVNNIYNILNLSGVQILIFLSGLRSVSPSVYEAAQIEGATAWESFWKITFPMIGPLIFLNLVYSIIDSFTNPENKLIRLINEVGFERAKYGIASAMGWIYTLLTAAFVLAAVFLAARTMSDGSGKNRKNGI